MSENYGDTNKTEPDFFGFYTSEVTELLSQDESIWPFSNQTSQLPQDLHEVGKEKGKSKNSSRTKENIGISGSAAPLFSNGVGALISEFKNERLKSLLRQSVFSLTQEVDEIVDPILSLCRIRTCFKYKESLALECKADRTQHANTMGPKTAPTTANGQSRIARPANGTHIYRLQEWPFMTNKIVNQLMPIPLTSMYILLNIAIIEITGRSIIEPNIPAIRRA